MQLWIKCSSVTGPGSSVAKKRAAPPGIASPKWQEGIPLSDKPIRVKDRRMFTTDGELREEYREMMKNPPEKKAEQEVEERASEKPAQQAPSSSAPPAVAPGPAGAAPAKAPPAAIETQSGATFQDLIALLAQSASAYLQQAAHVPLEHRAESIELARMHIDLLVILKAKTEGNLDTMEQALLDDVVYRLRLAAVERT